MIPADFHTLTTNEFTSDSQIFWSEEFLELFDLGQFESGQVEVKVNGVAGKWAVQLGES